MSILDEITYHECDLTPLKRVVTGKFDVTINGKGKRGVMYKVRDGLRHRLKRLVTVDKTYMKRNWEYCSFGMDYVEYHINFTLWLSGLRRDDFLELMNLIVDTMKAGYKDFTYDVSAYDKADIIIFREMNVKNGEMYLLTAPFTEENINAFTGNYF